MVSWRAGAPRPPKAAGQKRWTRRLALLPLRLPDGDSWRWVWFERVWCLEECVVEYGWEGESRLVWHVRDVRLDAPVPPAVAS